MKSMLVMVTNFFTSLLVLAYCVFEFLMNMLAFVFPDFEGHVDHIYYFLLSWIGHFGLFFLTVGYAVLAFAGFIWPRIGLTFLFAKYTYGRKEGPSPILLTMGRCLTY